VRDAVTRAGGWRGLDKVSSNPTVVDRNWGFFALLRETVQNKQRYQEKHFLPKQKQ
jgi:hypothetical protein